MSLSESNEFDILLIEPSRLHREVLLNHINLAELTTKCVESESEVLEVLESVDLKLIICAAELSKMKGYELAQKIREKIGDTTPILLLTSSNEKQLLDIAFRHGVTEVIPRNHLASLHTYFGRINECEEVSALGTGRILCIEDSKSISDLIKCVLEDLGQSVDVLTKAEDALARLLGEKEDSTDVGSVDYDLIITDILLEGKMTGIGLTREIRQQAGQLGRIPILAISGLDNIDQRIEALRQGATDFVSKPINFDELDARVKNLITAKKLYDKVVAQERELRKMAVTDPLTGLYNRHYLSDVGIKRVEEAKRHQQSLSLIIIDIDHFKKVNDTYGHASGDAVLKQVGMLLKRSCRQEDFAVRFGGEEFVLVLPHCSLENALKKAEVLRNDVKVLKPEDIPLTSSFGVASFDKNSDISTFNQLFQLADKAVYYSKENGRDRVTCMTEIENETGD